MMFEAKQLFRRCFGLFFPHNDTFRGGWQATYSGKRFYPLDPRAEDVDLNDIAHSLSMQTRFTGHCVEFYSIAQHCVLVSRLCNPENALWGLLHDASESYVCDIPSELKHSPEFKFYRKIEKNVMNSICLAFGLSLDEPLEIKKIDKRLLATEARDLMISGGRDWNLLPEPFDFVVEPWTQQRAKEEFLARFKELTQ